MPLNRGLFLYFPSNLFLRSVFGPYKIANVRKDLYTHCKKGLRFSRGGQKDDFQPYPGGGGHGVQGQICHILTPASYESLPVPSGHRFPHFDTYIWGGGGRGAMILDRCRAFDLFASVDAHLCSFPVPSRDVTNQTLPVREDFHYSQPGRVWQVTFRLGTGKSINFFLQCGIQGSRFQWSVEV